MIYSNRYRDYLKKTRFALALVGMGLCGGLASSTVYAEGKMPTLSAGVREYFITQDKYTYGSDTMARVMATSFSEGFESLTLAVRLGVNSMDGSSIEATRQRSRMKDLDVIIARTKQANRELVFKPIITRAHQSSMIDRATLFSPKNVKTFYATYKRDLKPYFTRARRYALAEIVLGVGMNRLWAVENAPEWIKFVQMAKREVGPKTRLSIELTSNADLNALEGWKRAEEASFIETGRHLDRIRIAGSSIGSIENTVKRVLALFPDAKITLSNVTIPGCKETQWAEDEVQCVGNSVSYTEELKLKQLNDLTAWIKNFSDLPAPIRERIVEVEFREATTQFEPDDGAEDPRFLLYNPKIRGVFLKWKGDLKVNFPEPTRVHGRGLASGPSPVKKQACVFYDRKDSSDFIGGIHSTMLQTLLGAFRSWNVSTRPMSQYEGGGLKSCDAAFYIASNFSLSPSQEFYEDAIEFAHKKPLVWMNYKFQTFSEFFNGVAEEKGGEKIGFTTSKIDQPLMPPTLKELDPGYYRYFEYKGETFEKAARWNRSTNRFASSPELNLIDIQDPSKVQVLASARHSKLNTRTPYSVRKTFASGGSIWYIADLPFAYVDFGSPYFILCDLLWDILREEAPKGPQPALIRIEDVNPTQNQADLRWTIDYLADRNIPFALAVIPYYSNLFQDPEGKKPVVWKPAHKYAEFVGTLRYAKARGASFVFHGVEHMAGDLISGFDGESAADYEFWMYPQDKPHPRDSSDYVMDKLERGEEVFKRLNIIPRAWESPHYAASALDYVLFGKLFTWNYHRSIYFDVRVKEDAALPKNLRMFNDLNPQQRGMRRDILRNVKLEGNFNTFSGQIVPYPIFKDSYGQAIIPETLGFIDYAFFTENPIRPVTRPADLILQAKRLRAVRGAYASFFWHPDLVSPSLLYYEQHPGNFKTEGGRNTLIKTVEAIQQLGYQFRSIDDRSLFPDL
jgi:uncharacterized protein YdaL